LRMKIQQNPSLSEFQRLESDTFLPLTTNSKINAKAIFDILINVN